MTKLKGLLDTIQDDNLASNGTFRLRKLCLAMAVSASMLTAAHANADTLTIQEQTDGFCKVEGSVDNNNSGFSGAGFANTDNEKGKSIEWGVEVGEQGSYTLQWRYASASDNNRSGSVQINDSNQLSVDFSGTGSWSTWNNTSSVTVALKKGFNKIALDAESNEGLANIDYLAVSGNSSIKGTCSDTTTPPPPPPPVPVPGEYSFDTNVPMGWAVVPGYGRETTTGGAGGSVVTATNASQLSSYLSDDTPRIVRIQGTISGSGHIDMGDNKTIIGDGSNAKIVGAYLNANGNSNIIIRNIEVTGGVDAIAFRNADHIWIDHVYVHAASDGLIDITRESDMYTVSWTEFANHHKTMLLNGGSRHYDDRGKLNGTLHHNYFNATKSRNPRAGFGKIHIFNDFNYANNYGIGFHTESKVLAENNYFKDMSKAIHQMYTNADELGDAKAVGNVFDNASGDESTGIGFDPTQYYLYNFVLDDAADVPSVVQAGVGPSDAYSEIGLMPIPGQGTVGVSDSTLEWKTGTYSPNSYKVYFGTTTSPEYKTSTSSTSYNAGSLQSGKTYYWRVDQVTNNGTIEGNLWTFKAK